MVSRRQFILFSCCFIFVLTLPGCEWLADKPITIAAHVWPGYELMFLARSKGWLDAKRVHLVETTSATDSLKELDEGKVAVVVKKDVAFSMLPCLEMMSFLEPFFVDSRILSPVDSSFGNYLTIAQVWPFLPLHKALIVG